MASVQRRWSQESDHRACWWLGSLAYNPYYGSVDIDLVTNNKTKSSLKNYLVTERGYVRSEGRSGPRGTFKAFQSMQIDVDFANRGPDKFEGRSDDLHLSNIDAHTTTTILNGLEVPVPTRSFLLLMKLKACWDRNWRLQNGLSWNEGHERGKMIKDYSDVLALADPERGGTGLEIGFLGTEFERLSFLKGVIDNIGASMEAADKYEIEFGQAQEIIERFADIVF